MIQNFLGFARRRKKNEKKKGEGLNETEKFNYCDVGYDCAEPEFSPEEKEVPDFLVGGRYYGRDVTMPPKFVHEPEMFQIVKDPKSFNDQRALIQESSVWEVVSDYNAAYQSILWEGAIQVPHGCIDYSVLYLVCLVRRRPSLEKIRADQYLNVSPSSVIPWYIAPGFVERFATPSQLPIVPSYDVLIEKRPDFLPQLLSREEFGNDEFLVLPRRYFRWPKPSGLFGNKPKFPMHVKKGSIIKQLDTTIPFAIPSHEMAKESGMLLELTDLLLLEGRAHSIRNGGSWTAIDSYKVPAFVASGNRGFVSPTCRILFVSHRWLTPNGENPHPDNELNIKLKALQNVCNNDDLVFFDFWSIPQSPNKLEDRINAVHSLNIYVDWCSEFIALCPDKENHQQYQNRGWTNVEMVCSLVPMIISNEVMSTKTYSYYGNKTNRVSFVLGADGKYEPVTKFHLLNPSLWQFGYPQDFETIQPLLKEIKNVLQTMKDKMELETHGYGSTEYNGSLDIQQVLEELAQF